MTLPSPSSDEPFPLVAAFIAHWESLRPGPGLLPGRQHFDPMLVPKFLPNITLIDVLPGPPHRFQLRLVGGAVVEAGFAGKPGDFMDAPHVATDPAKVLAKFNAIVDSRRPDWRRGPATVEHTKYVDSLERAMVPLARDGIHVDMIMVFTVFHWRNGRTT